MDKEVRLKIGDKIIEDDGICTIVYEIIQILGRKAVGQTKFEGKVYHTAYKVRYKDAENIEIYKPIPGDLTTRRLIR